MRRRDFLAMGIAMTIAARTGIGRGAPSKASAAVVIGVDKPGNLPALRGAAAGARSVAEWLGGEGFEIRAFVDDGAPVTANSIYTAIADLVNRGTLDQLVVYFAGHGFIGNYAEFWMLSGAPENPNEAISLRERRTCPEFGDSQCCLHIRCVPLKAGQSSDPVRARVTDLS